MSSWCFLFLFFFTQWSWRISGSLDPPLPSVGVIGVLIPIHSSPDCQKIDPTFVRLLTAADWQIGLLNQDQKRNFTFEIEVLDICESLSAVKATSELIRKYTDGPKKLLGIVLYSPSQDAMMVSKFINSLPIRYRVVQVGITQTAYELNNPLKYEGFFRILPDDRTQMQMICDVLWKINWNYVAVLYEDDVYGRQGAEFLTKCAKEKNILIGVKLKINKEDLEILELDRREISGSVVIAHHATVQKFFQKNLFGRDMSFLFSEAVNMYDNLFAVYSKGAVLVIQTAFSQNEKFQDYWRSLFNDTTLNTTTSPYFRAMVQQVSKCSFSDPNNKCDLKDTLNRLNSRMSPADNTESIAMSIYAIARNVGGIFQVPPNPRDSILPLYKQALEKFQKPIDFSFLKTQLGYNRLGLEAQFNRSGAPLYPQKRTFYDLFYREKTQNPDEAIFIDVGNYSIDGLQLSKFTFPKYDGKGQVERVTCPKEFDCKKNLKSPIYIYKEGDIMFIGLAPVHDRDLQNGFLCSRVRSNSGYSIVEGMLYGLKELNERRIYKDLFPGKTIGMLVIDTCDSEIITMKRLFALRNNDPSICGRDFNCSKILEKVPIYVGPLSSQISSVMGKIMTVQNTVQISYGATSALLSNRDIYPNYMRTCTSDAQQVKVITDLLVAFDWRYVSLIYTDELYGHTFKKDFYELIEKYNICLIREIPYSDNADIKEIIRILRERPEAKTVILYIRSNQLKRFLVEFEGYMIYDNEFIFIGSETWADKLKLGKIAKRINGSFTLSLEIYENQNYNKYIKEKVLKERDMNFWLQDYVEKECYMPLSNDKTAGKACPPNYRLKDSGFKSVWMYMALDALNVAALALNKSISEMCPEEGLVCPEMFLRIKDVIRNLKNVKLRNQRVFDENGDGATGYHIFKFHPDDTYERVGYWSRTDRITFKPGFKRPLLKTKCPNKKHCSECIDKVLRVPVFLPEEENYSVSLIFFVILLVILLGIIIAFIYMFRKERSEELTQKSQQLERRPDGHETEVKYQATPKDSKVIFKTKADGQEDMDSEETLPKGPSSIDETPVMTM